ncbi:MAG: ABC transporter substrate-binding protein [Faecousia sp.]
MKKGICLLLALALWLGCFSGCARSIDNSGYVATGDAILMEGQDPEDILPAQEDTQNLTLAYYPTRSMNPLYGSDYTNRVVMSLIYQGLFAVDAKNNTTPILCAKYYVTPDNRTWTIYLEPNATFSDGTRVTAQDVIATYEQARENVYYKGRFTHIARIELSSDGGVDFFLDTPYQNLALLLDIPIVKASEVAADHPLGTGPYSLEEGVSGMHLQRVTNWWCGSTELAAKDSSIALVEAESPAQVRDEFEFSDVSVVCTNPQTDSYADYRCDYELWEVDNGYMMYIGCNVTYSNFFDDGTLRTFLTYGIDRDTLVKDNYGGLALPTTLPVSPMLPYYSKSLAANYEYDEMRFIDAASRFRVPTNERGVARKLQLLVNSDDSARLRCARSIAATLTELGLACETVEKSTATYESMLQAANFDIYLGITKLPTTMDLSEFYRPWGDMSWGGLANETIYNMVKQSMADRGNYYNLHKLVADDGRIIPVMFGYYAIYAKRGLLSDLSPARDNVFYYSLGKTMEDCKAATEYS